MLQVFDAENVKADVVDIDAEFSKLEENSVTLMKPASLH